MKEGFMYSHDDLKSLHAFLKSTNEGGLKKMLVGGKMTETHLRLLLKVVRAVNETEFITHCEADSFPKVKMGAPEIAIKESFWGTCLSACAAVGLVTAPAKAA
jgi:hypothetical protein